MALSRRTEGASGHDRDVLFLEEPAGERLRVQPRRGDLREGVERAERFECVEAHRVEAVHDEAPAPVVFGPHALDLGLAIDEGHERGVLGDGRRRHDPVLVDLHDPLEDPCGRRQPADPPAGHRVGLREAAHENRPIAHAGDRRERPVPVRPVGEAVVDLVAVDEEVVTLGDRRELVLDLACQDRAGRVAGVAEEQGLRPGRDRRLDGCRVQREVVLEARGDVDGAAAGEDDRGHVGDV